jgi:hypothetical protein
MDERLISMRRDVAKMAEDLIDVVGVPLEQTTELQRQILATFAFGMIYAEGRMRALSPPEVQALAISCLMDVFNYADHQAGAFSAALIQHASNNDPQDTHSAIIHRGIDGHRQWQAGDVAQLKENVLGIFDALGASVS